MSRSFDLTRAGGVLVLLSLGATAAQADVPRVATDIAPVHGLVARVMDGLGTPDLVVQPGSSPHSYAMRPSEARALEQADAVFWIGPALEPWLGDTIGTLAGDARVVELLEAEGVVTLDFREGASFEGHDHADDHAHEGEAHDHGDADHADHEHDHEGEEHAEHGHDHDGEDHAAHDHDHDHEGEEHAEHDHEHEEHAAHDHDDHAGHDHEGVDPHAWLDPENGKVWLDLIAEELAELDPENAETYRENAAAGQEEIDAAVQDADATLASVDGISFVVFHDAYHYFEARFGLSAAGAISLSDASDPSPARVEEVRDTIRALDVSCVFSEPQFNQNLVATVSEGTDAQAAVIDPLGFDLDPGATFYPDLIRSIADSIAGCATSS